MAYSYIWPPTLPQKPNTNYSESGGVLILRTPMDAGPAKMRKRGAKPSPLQLTFDMSTEQVEVLEIFAKDTLQGVTRFGFPHPRTGDIIEARIIPQGDGELYNINYILPERWSVSMQFEVLP